MLAKRMRGSYLGRLPKAAKGQTSAVVAMQQLESPSVDSSLAKRPRVAVSATETEPVREDEHMVGKDEHSMQASPAHHVGDIPCSQVAVSCRDGVEETPAMSYPATPIDDAAFGTFSEGSPLRKDAPLRCSKFFVTPSRPVGIEKCVGTASKTGRLWHAEDKGSGTLRHGTLRQKAGCVRRSKFFDKGLRLEYPLRTCSLQQADIQLVARPLRQPRQYTTCAAREVTPFLRPSSGPTLLGAPANLVMALNQVNCNLSLHDITLGDTDADNLVVSVAAVDGDVDLAPITQRLHVQGQDTWQPVIASGRAVDILKWVCARGAHDVACQLDLHDTTLMHNAVHGRLTHKSASAVKAPRAHAILTAHPSGRCSRASATAAAEASSLWSSLVQKGFRSTYALLSRAQLMVAVMEEAGMPFDGMGLSHLVQQWRTEASGVEAEVHRIVARTTGRAQPFLNLKSNEQVGQLIASQLSADEVACWPRTPCGALRTDSVTLKRSQLPFVSGIVRYRELHHSLSHYEPFSGAAAVGAGRLYPMHHLGGAVTGRMSCTNPNLHGIPRDPAFRALVAAPAPGLLVKGDYSQIELRVLAEVSGDSRMQHAFASGQDLHRMTAAALLGIQETDVTSEERQLAKAVNFGLIYGQSANGLQQYSESQYGVSLTITEAHSARRKFFEIYPEVAKWQREQRRRASHGMPVATPNGRVAHHLLASWRSAASAAGSASASRKATSEYSIPRVEREALNFPIQGGAAEVMLACLGRLRLHMRSSSPDRRCRLVCVVHDEFLFQCDDASVAEEMASVLQLAMRDSWNDVFRTATPLGSTGMTIGIGPNWAELVPWDGSR